MTLWKPLPIRPGLKVGNEFIVTREAANAGSSIALYYTPQRGWYGWASMGELDLPAMERLYPLLSQSGYVVQVPASQILKMADAIRLDAPDEISTETVVCTPAIPDRIDTISANGDGETSPVDIAVKPERGVPGSPKRRKRKS